MTASMPSAPHFDRLLLTGTAGVLGRVLRTGLKPHCTTLQLSDINPPGDAATGEELAPCCLEAADAMLGLLAGVDAVVHLGGVSTEQPWGVMLPANILGLHKLYEAARHNGVRRIVFASANHVTGCCGASLRARLEAAELRREAVAKQIDSAKHERPALTAEQVLAGYKRQLQDCAKRWKMNQTGTTRGRCLPNCSAQYGWFAKATICGQK